MTAPPRLVVLDGMRGAAAAMVLIHHASLLAGNGHLLPRGYLSVDFFFMLSGFVMTRTYEGRLAAGLDARTFLRARLRRLYPTMAAGIVLGAVVLWLNGAGLAPLLVALAVELLFVPRLGTEWGVYSLDGVQWSLTFELLANLLHALVLHRLGLRALGAIVLGSLLVLALVGSVRGGIAVGDRGTTFGWGLPRVLFSYAAGIVLARSRWRLGEGSRRGGLAATASLVAVVAGAGLVPAATPGWLADLAVVALAFPVLIVWGATAQATPAASRVMSAAGALSFPLYAAHLPAISLALLLWGTRLGSGPALFGCALVLSLAVSGGLWRITTRRAARIAAAAPFGAPAIG